MTTLYWSLRGVSCVAAVFVLIVGVLMMRQYRGMVRSDPLDAPELADARLALSSDLQNQGLRANIRQMDLRIRKAYFGNRARLQAGAVLLAAGGAVWLFCWQVSSELRRRVALPRKVERDEEIRMLRRSRALVLLFGLLLLAAALLMAYRIRSGL